MGFNATEEQNFRIFQDSNKIASEYARHAISFAFYLNGAAATAILATGKTDFYGAAIWMGFGAVCAVLCIGISYFYMLIVADTWRQEETERNGVKGFNYQIWNSLVFISTKNTEKLRYVPIVFWVLSIIFFIFGLISALSHLCH